MTLTARLKNDLRRIPVPGQTGLKIAFVPVGNLPIQYRANSMDGLRVFDLPLGRHWSYKPHRYQDAGPSQT
jgi:hypothetical protein